MREMESKGIYIQQPRNLLFVGCFSFLKNYGFASSISNLLSMTTLGFFDVPDSFLTLF